MFHILVVDDDKNTRKLIEAVLRRENFTVSTSENGKDALEKLDGEHIDLVVLDVMMPEMDGYEFTKTLRESENDIPILMVSAKQLPTDKHKGFWVGTDDYITNRRRGNAASYKGSFAESKNSQRTPHSCWQCSA